MTLESRFFRDGQLDVTRLQDAIREACDYVGFEMEQYGTQDHFPLYGGKRQCDTNSPTVYISTGMHGDEPAGPLALLKILEDNALPLSMNFVICPLLNPMGLSLGTRENGQEIDLNRDYSNPSTPEVKAHISWLDKQSQFDLAILMHEDYDASGFYINDFVCSEESASVARTLLTAVGDVCPLEDDPVIDGRPAHDGVACPWEDKKLKRHWTECFYLRKNEAAFCFNFESPSLLPLETRIAAQIVAIKTAFDLVSKRVTTAS
jgi:hypothetical protein